MAEVRDSNGPDPATTATATPHRRARPLRVPDPELADGVVDDIGQPGTTRRPTRPSPLPWTVGNLLTLCVAYVVGGSCLMAGWYVTSRRGTPDLQVAPIALAAAGCAGSLLAGPVWMMVGRRSVGIRLRSVLERIEGIDVAPTAQQPLAARSTFVATAVMKSFHLPDCQLVVGKNAPQMPRDEHVLAGRAPCKVCVP